MTLKRRSSRTFLRCSSLIPSLKSPMFSPDPVAEDPAPLSGGLEAPITTEELVQDIIMPPSSPMAIQDATASDLPRGRSGCGR